MPTISPTCTVKDGSGPPMSTVGGVDVTPGNTITIALASAAGVDVWGIEVFGNNDAISAPALTIDSVAKTATFVSPAAGGAIILKSTVTSRNGVDANGRSPAVYSTTFKITTPINGYRLVAANETSEAGSAFGWSTPINAAITGIATNPGGGGPGVTYTAHNAITAGQTVATYGTGNVVQVATPSILQGGAAIVGIALTTVAGGATVVVAPVGSKVSSGVVTLGAGKAARVGINGTGNPVRLAHSVGGWEVGSCDTAGVISVDPRTPIGQSAFVGYNPAVWGLIANDWSQCIANSVAWAAMMADIGAAGSGLGHQVFISDTYYFHAYVPVNRTVKLEGLVANGSSVGGNGRLVVPTGTRCLVIECAASSADGGDGNLSVVEHLEFQTAIPPFVGARSNGANVAAGTFYTIPGETRYYLLATTSGTTAGSLPAALTVGNGAYAPLPRGTVTDGGVTWRYYAYAFDFVHTWQPLTAYAIGDMARLYGDARYTLVCTTPGISASTPNPSMGVAGQLCQDGQTGITDGSVVWRIDCYNAVAAKSTVQLNKLATAGAIGTPNFTNFAYHLQADLTVDQTSVDNSVLTNLVSLNGAGGGLYVAGSDANAVISYGHSFGSTGLMQDGDCGVGIWDRSQSGNAYHGCYVQNGSGSGFISQAQSGIRWDSCHAENYKDPRWMGLAHITNCTDGASIDGSVRSTSSTNVSQGGTFQDIQSAPNLQMQVDTGDGRAFVFQRLGDTGKICWRLDTASSGSQDTWTLGNYPFGANGLPALTLGGPQSKQGVNVLWLHKGAIYGDTNKHVVGFDADAKTLNLINGGARGGGDRFPRVDVPTAGDVTYDVAWSGGVDAPAWLGTTVVAPLRRHGPNGYRRMGDTTVGDNIGYTYICTKPGTTGGSAPTWSDATTVLANAPITYATGIDVSPEEYYRATTGGTDGQGRIIGNGHYYQAQRPTAWAANTEYLAHSVIASTSAETELYFTPAIDSYISGNYIVGKLVTPSHSSDPAFGMVYQVISLTSGANPGNFGGNFANLGDEPGYGTLTGTPWPTNYTSTVTTGSGILKRVHLMSGATEPKWSTNWTQIFATTGKTHDGVDSIDWVWGRIKLQTNSAAPTFGTGAGSTTLDNASATLPSSTNTPNGYGLVWVEIGAETAASRVADGTAEWTKYNFAPGYFQESRYFEENAAAVAVNGNITLTRRQAFGETTQFSGAGGFTVTLTTGAGNALINGAHYSFYNGASSAVTIAPGAISLAAGAACHCIYNGTSLIRCT